MRMNGNYQLRLVGKDADLFWRPSVYFQNSKDAHLPDVTVENQYAGPIFNGQMEYVTRIVAEFSCAMDFGRYPFDTQKCPIRLGLLGYSTREVRLVWDHKAVPFQGTEGQEEVSPVHVAPDAREMAEFHLRSWENKSETRNMTKYDQTVVLIVELTLERQLGYFVIQVFTPTVLLAIISWLSFWVDHTAVPARMALCITTVLTLQTIASGLQSRLPAVSYYKAIDAWFIVCQSFIFYALLEFVFSHHLTKIQGHKAKTVPAQSSSSKRDPSLAVKMDCWSRFLCPIFFLSSTSSSGRFV